jgi:predicted metal-dependent phosphoesterase TrpH
MIKDIKVDLHMHTIASDGAWTPDVLVEEAKKNNIGLMSVTDHDSTDNVLVVEELCKKNNIKFIRGVEISSSFNKDWFHILGYNINIENKQLKELLYHNTYLMEKKDDDTIKMLIDDGYNIDFNEYKKYEYKLERGGWKALNFLIDIGICVDVADFFGRLFSETRKVPFPKFPSSKEVIGIIKKAGGVPILAHPEYLPIDFDIEYRLNEFKYIGIEGVECYHPNHSKETTDRCLKWCKENYMLITAGSDCHGNFIPNRKLGNPQVFLSELNLGRIFSVDK